MNLDTTFGAVDRLGRQVWKSRSQVIDAALCSAVALGSLLLLEIWIGGYVPLRYLYLIPVWVAAQRGGQWGGFIGGLATSIVCLWVDASLRETIRAPEISFVVRTVFFVAFGLIVAIKEESLRTIDRLAKVDPVTGSYNRRGFAELATRALSQVVVRGQTATVILFDCDRFKIVNDRFGHAAGDEVLRTIAQTLEMEARSTDIVARLGGDEFVVLLPHTARIGAKVFAERVQQSFAREVALLGFEWLGLSFGIAERNVDGRTLAQMVESADREMYVRKTACRESLAPVTLR